MFTVPYDKGWKAFSDNQELRISRAAGDLIAIKVPSGENEIRLEYHTPGRAIGNTISCLFLIITVAYLVFQKKQEKK
jgi:uncharacterized membrane protein YfhO